MSIVLRYMVCKDFPDLAVGEEISNRVQTSLPWGDESTETSMTRAGLAADETFERYDVLHQVEKDVDAFYNQQPMRRYIENRRFPAYYNRDRGYFLVNAGGQEVGGMFDRLAHKPDPIRATRELINLLDVMPLGTATGGYFGHLRIAKVRTAAVFGTHTVVESEEWEHYAEHGDLRVVYMKVMGEEGEVRSLTLLTDRSVVLMKDYGERDNLQFVRELQVSIDGVVPD